MRKTSMFRKSIRGALFKESAVLCPERGERAVLCLADGKVGVPPIRPLGLTLSLVSSTTHVFTGRKTTCRQSGRLAFKGTTEPNLKT